MRDGRGGGVSGWLKGLLGRPATPPAPLPDLVLPAGEGPLVWMRIGMGYDQHGPDETSLPQVLIQLLAQMRRQGLQIAVSRAGGEMPDLSTRGVSAIPDPAPAPAPIAAHLQVLQPDAILLIGPELPRPLIDAARSEDVPLLIAEARLSAPGRRHSIGAGLLERQSYLARLDRLLLPDIASCDIARDHGVPDERIELIGPITLTRAPLPHNEAERESLAEALAGRQLWLAVGVTEAEEPAVIEAHLTVLRYSHRAMLIALPDDPARADAMAARMTEAGLVVAQRAMDEDPTEEVNVYLADDPYEMGLWYRLAPVCFMGSTLAGPTAAARDPFEAASLGSAAIHGPQSCRFAAEWAQLDGAEAAYAIDSDAQLADAVVGLLAPDQAARLATNAWAVSTGGAGVANRIAVAVRETVAPEAA